MKTISILHTIPQSVAPLQKAFDCRQGVNVQHYVDPSIVKQVAADGGLDNATQRRFVRAALHAAEDADVLVIACTLCCRYAELLESILDIPVLEADIPMLQAAAQHFRKVGIVSTKETIAAQCHEKLTARFGQSIETCVRIVPSATDQAAIQIACKELDQMQVEAVLMTQLSLGDTKEFLTDLRCPVYTAPGFLAAAAIQAVGAEI